MERFEFFVICALAAYIVASRVWARYQRNIRWKMWTQNDVSDTANQLRFVAGAHFNVKSIVNKEAYPIFKTVEQFAGEKRAGYRVLPEVCLGAVLWCREDDREYKAFKSINSKRVDFGIIDKFGKLKVAIEYQGTGHWRGDAVGRDAVKRAALEKAGVKVIEIFPEESPQDIKDKLSVAIQ